ncbi:MAG: hypothetical protein IPP19_05745 [Verrucomicrobia bacterium]|nr:hypothetical protein [Verrucomicrobiota bacterium]
MKNVLALAAGILDGMGLGDVTQGRAHDSRHR